VVGALIRMKLTVMRRTASGPRANTMLVGGVLGIAAAIGTIAIATLEPEQMTTVMDLLAIGFAAWAIGWTLAPPTAASRSCAPSSSPCSRSRRAWGRSAP